MSEIEIEIHDPISTTKCPHPDADLKVVDFGILDGARVVVWACTKCGHAGSHCSPLTTKELQAQAHKWN